MVIKVPPCVNSSYTTLGLAKLDNKISLNEWGDWMENNLIPTATSTQTFIEKIFLISNTFNQELNFVYIKHKTWSGFLNPMNSSPHIRKSEAKFVSIWCKYKILKVSHVYNLELTTYLTKHTQEFKTSCKRNKNLPPKSKLKPFTWLYFNL